MTDAATQKPKIVRIGKITGCQGLKGDLKVRPAQYNPDWATGKDTLKTVEARLKDKTLSLTVASVRQLPNLLTLRFEGYPDRTAAEKLLGAELFAAREDLPAPQADEFWVDDLIGLAVYEREGGRHLGHVADILSAGGQDYLEVAPLSATDKKDDFKIIPFVKRFFPVIDPVNGRLEVSGLPGFFDDETDDREPDASPAGSNDAPPG